MEKEIFLKKATINDIHDLLIDTPSVISGNASIYELLAKMNEDLRTRHVYVVDESNKLIGSVRMNTVVQYLFPVKHSHQLSKADFQSLTVSKIMNPDPCYVLKSTTLSEMAKILLEEHINELPVVDENLKLIGQANVHEIIMAYLDKSDELSIRPGSLLYLIP